MAKFMTKNVVCVVFLLLVAMAGAQTPPGIAKNPSHARCNIKKYKHCYNLEHVCPKFCPDSCTVECASCKPICGGSTTSPPDSKPAPETPTPSPSQKPPSPSTPNPTPIPSTPNPNKPSSPTPKPPKPSPATPSTPTPKHPTPSPTPSTPTPTPPTPSPATPSTPTPKPPTPSPTPSTPTPTPPTPSPATPSTPTPKPPTPSPTPSTPTLTPPRPSPTTPSTPTPTVPPTPSPTTPSTPTPTPLTPSPTTPSTPTPGPSSPTPTSPTPYPTTPLTPTPTTPSSPADQTPSTPTTTTPSSPSPAPDSASSAMARKAKCKNKNYPQCYNVQHVCPSACPDQCEVDCVTCKPVCNCDKPGAVCQDPRFVGGDGITFYFHGKKDQDFCLVTDSDLHINAHFIGKRNRNMKRDFTWVQSIGILFDSHKFFIGSHKTSTWDDTINHLDLSFDGESIHLPETEGANWQSETVPKASITRFSNTDNVIIEVDGLFKITAKVVPISEQESLVHNYGITQDDCFAHLDLGFKFYALSDQVSGVLGQTYRGDYVSRVNMGASMPVLGGEKEFATSSLFATDCSTAVYTGTRSNVHAASQSVLQMPSLSCSSNMNGKGVICKR